MDFFFFSITSERQHFLNDHHFENEQVMTITTDQSLILRVNVSRKGRTKFVRMAPRFRENRA